VTLEGGFWAVVETSDAAKAEDADIIAVLGPSDQIPGLSVLTRTST
jgi:hypothetical protein